MESKQQRNARLKAMRKKYHLGEFKKNKSVKRKVYKVRVSKNSMVRKKVKYSSRKSSFNLKGGLIGGAGVLLYKNLISSMVPLSGNVKVFAEMGVGYWLSKKKGIVGDFGKMLFLIDAYHLGHVYLAPMLNSVGGQTSAVHQVYY